MSSPSWFLPAFLMSRLLFSFILKFAHSNYLLYSLIISSISLLLTKQLSLNTLLAFTSATGSLIFVAFGYYAKKQKIIEQTQRSCYKHLFLFVAILLWLNTSLFGRIDMHINSYKLWIIDYLGACGGTYLFYNISQLIEKHLHILKSLLSIAGFYSLVILSFHAIEYLILYFLQPLNNCTYVFLFRLMYSIITVYMTININPVKRLFFPNTLQLS